MVNLPEPSVRYDQIVVPSYMSPGNRRFLARGIRRFGQIPKKIQFDHPHSDGGHESRDLFTLVREWNRFATAA
jgi:hypothetical protein